MSSSSHPITFSSDSDSETSLPILPPPPPVRRHRHVRQLQIYEPEPFGQPFRRYGGGPVCKHTPRKRVHATPTPRVLPPSPPAPAPPVPPPSPPIPTPFVPPAPVISPTSPMTGIRPSPSSSLEHPRTIRLSPVSPPTVFYRQTTTVPLSAPGSPTITSLSAPPRRRPRLVVSSLSDPGEQTVTEATSRPKTRRRVDARRWSFLLPLLQYWRSQEGAPSARELGENSSSAASRILPVTGEPVHHTIPLLAARLVRHEDRLDDIVSIINDFPLDHVEAIGDEVENLVISQIAMEESFELMGTRLQEAIETIDTLGGIAIMMQGEIESQDDEIDRISIQATTLRGMIRDSRARERTRDRTIETMMTMIRDLQRRLDGAPGSS